MVLGGRLKGDKGAVLVYESENLKECGNARTISNWTGRNFCLYHHRA